MRHLLKSIEKAINHNATTITVEYKDGYEEITIYNGSTGFMIDSVKSGSKEAQDLYDDIFKLKKNKKITIGDNVIYTNVSTYDSFGETAYRIHINEIRNKQNTD